MKLEVYLKIKPQTMQSFANEIGVHVSTIHRIKYGKIVPSRRLIEAIFKATDGKVTPSDLIEIQGK